MATYPRRKTVIAGVDEAGRGPLAGPVVAAAVILPIRCRISGLRDSKQTTLHEREELFREIQAKAVSIGVGVIDVATIDAINIHRATLLAMYRAVIQLTQKPTSILVDGLFPIPSLTIEQHPIPKGDETVPVISAASIIAKVTRDRMMMEYDKLYPAYGFSNHKGYGTLAHMEAIRKHGPSTIHRRSFSPLKGAHELCNPLEKTKVALFTSL